VPYNFIDQYIVEQTHRSILNGSIPIILELEKETQSLPPPLFLILLNKCKSAETMITAQHTINDFNFLCLLFFLIQPLPAPTLESFSHLPVAQASSTLLYFQ
jgi:hypothetical protein